MLARRDAPTGSLDTLPGRQLPKLLFRFISGLTGGVLPSTYLTGNPADLVPFVITTVLLAWAVKSC